jgi:hypothetical protein
MRHDLESLKKRLKAFEAKSAQEGILLTEEQLAALEKMKSHKEKPRAKSRPTIQLSWVRRIYILSAI